MAIPPRAALASGLGAGFLLSSLMTLKNDLQLLPDVVVQFPAHHWFRDEVKRRYSSFRVRGNRYMRLSADGEITDGLSGMRT